MKKTAIFLICLTLSIIAVFSTLYKVDMHRMEIDEPVVFSTWGAEYAPAEAADAFVSGDVKSDISEDIHDNIICLEIDVDTVNPRGLNAEIINNSDSKIGYLDYYRIEKKMGDEWCYFDYDNELEPYWDNMTYIIEPGEVAYVSFYWSEMYGELDNGEYRIIKEYYDNADMSNRLHYLYGEFVLH